MSIYCRRNVLRIQHTAISYEKRLTGRRAINTTTECFGCETAELDTSTPGLPEARSNVGHGRWLRGHCGGRCEDPSAWKAEGGWQAADWRAEEEVCSGSSGPAAVRCCDIRGAMNDGTCSDARFRVPTVSEWHSHQRQRYSNAIQLDASLPPFTCAEARERV